MNERIKIYAVTLAFVYVGMVVTYLVEAVGHFGGSMKEGKARVELESKGDMSNIFHLNVQPDLGFYTFPSEVSDKQQKKAVLEMDKVKIRQVISKADAPSGYFAYFGIKIVISLIIMACLLYVPFLFFKIVHAVTKGEIFGVAVVQRIIRIGWIVVAYFVISVLVELAETYFAKQLIQMDGYKVIFSIPSFITLILGLIILFLGEVLRVSLLMKEEQDLTI